MQNEKSKIELKGPKGSVFLSYDCRAIGGRAVPLSMSDSGYITLFSANLRLTDEEGKTLLYDAAVGTGNLKDSLVKLLKRQDRNIDKLNVKFSEIWREDDTSIKGDFLESHKISIHVIERTIEEVTNDSRAKPLNNAERMERAGKQFSNQSAENRNPHETARLSKELKPVLKEPEGKSHPPTSVAQFLGNKISIAPSKLNDESDGESSIGIDDNEEIAAVEIDTLTVDMFSSGPVSDADTKIEEVSNQKPFGDANTMAPKGIAQFLGGGIAVSKNSPADAEMEDSGGGSSSRVSEEASVQHRAGEVMARPSANRGSLFGSKSQQAKEPESDYKEIQGLVGNKKAAFEIQKVNALF